jgi:hypothetical protein
MEIRFQHGMKLVVPGQTPSMIRALPLKDWPVLITELERICCRDPHISKMLSAPLIQPRQVEDAVLLKWLATLLEYLPPNTRDWVEYLVLNTHPCLVQATKARASKHGDHRPGRNGMPNMITVSISGNAYQQFITTLHELAHNEVSLRFPADRTDPHGPEWQIAFQRLLAEALNQGFFPDPLSTAVRNYARCPKASSSRDESLQVALRQFDTADQRPMLATLPQGTWFSLDGKLVLQKGERLRTSFRCVTKDGRVYRVGSVARVTYIVR